VDQNGRGSQSKERQIKPQNISSQFETPNLLDEEQMKQLMSSSSIHFEDIETESLRRNTLKLSEGQL
jgi:hypothetical protein